MRALRRTCREMSHLLVERRERRLTATERVAAGFHLLACRMCRRFVVQLEVMDRAMDRWKAYREGPDG